MRNPLYETAFWTVFGIAGAVSCVLPVVMVPSQMVYEWLGLGIVPSVLLGLITQVVAIAAVLRVGLHYLFWKYGKEEPVAA